MDSTAVDASSASSGIAPLLLMMRAKVPHVTRLAAAVSNRMRRPGGFRSKSNQTRIRYVCVPVMVPLLLSVMLLMLLMLLCTRTALGHVPGSLLDLF